MIELLIAPITKILDKFIPDAGERARLAFEISTLAEKYGHEIALAQIETNKIEASHPSIFKGGWRPFIGWVCATALLYHFILLPVLSIILVMGGNENIILPDFDMDSLMTILLGILGLGGLRTFEKYKNIK